MGHLPRTVAANADHRRPIASWPVALDKSAGRIGIRPAAVAAGVEAEVALELCGGGTGCRTEAVADAAVGATIASDPLDIRLAACRCYRSFGVAIGTGAAANGLDCSRRNDSGFAVDTSVVDVGVAAAAVGAKVAAAAVGNPDSRSRSNFRDGTWAAVAKDSGRIRCDSQTAVALEEEER